MSLTVVDGWVCKEHNAGTEHHFRWAYKGGAELWANKLGLHIDKRSRSLDVPDNVFMWLAQAVRL